MNTHELSKIIIEKLDNSKDQLSKQFFSHNINTPTNFFILDDLLPEEVV